MINEDIGELLDYCRQQIEGLAFQAQSGKVNKVQLKNVMENMRSVLEYSAQEIANRLRESVTNVPTKIYFPYGQRENHFKISIKKNLPFIKDYEPAIYELLEEIQPFKANRNWLLDLCEMTNEVKHNNLSKTKKSKSSN